MGIDFSIFVVDKKGFEDSVNAVMENDFSKLKKSGVSDEHIEELKEKKEKPFRAHYLLYMLDDAKTGIVKELRNRRAYLSDALLATVNQLKDKDPNNELSKYADIVDQLCSGESPPTSVFKFSKISDRFWEDGRGGTYINALNVQESEYFIELLKKLLNRGLVFITSKSDYLLKREDLGEELEKEITLLEKKYNMYWTEEWVDMRSEFEDIIKGFEEFKSKEKCLIGFYC